MAIGPRSFIEAVNDISPSSVGCTIDNAKAYQTWRFNATQPTDVEDAIVFFLGETKVSISPQGNVQRLTPTAHPQFPYWTAQSISNLRGICSTSQVAGGFQKLASTLVIDTPPMPYFAFYPLYEMTVEYGPRPYSCLQDLYCFGQFGQWYNFANNLQHFNYCPEWLRYMDWELLPEFNSVTAQYGSMQFSNTGTSNGNVFPGMPRTFLPDAILNLIWYNVPARYLYSTNSYLLNHAWQGCVNQNAWPPNPGNGLQFPAGSLMFINAKPRKYTPSIRSTAPLPEQPNITTLPKLMDLNLTFAYTSRVAPAGETATQTNIATRNMIATGHNLLPWHVDRRFHYAQTKTGGANEYASFYSFPMELLFTDPDSTVTMYDGQARQQATVINNDGAAL